MGTLPKIFHTLFLWGHSQQCVIYFFFMHPPVVRMSGDKKRWCTPPMGVDGLASSQLIKQDSFIYIYVCTFFQCFALSGLPSFFKTYIYLWHLFDRYFPDIYLINKYDIDSRNSKNPTCTHTHTTHQTSLPPCQQFLGEFNESLGLGPFRINQKNIK
jgi:hypothetical protein